MTDVSRRALWSWLRPRPSAPPPCEPAPPLREPVMPARARMPEPRPLPPMLVPVIAPTACLATTTMCTVCVERCPRPGAIVTVGRTPRIVDAACDGCGRCIAACPAPTLAIGLTPRGPS